MNLRIQTLNKFFKQINIVKNINKEFGVKYAICYFLNKFIFRNEIFGGKYKEFYYTLIREYICKKYYFREKKECKLTQDKIHYDCNIWMMWWQGEKDMPELVRCCYRSVLKNKGTHNVILLDKDSYKEFVTLPEIIIEKYENGQIPLAQLVDMIRVELLYKYGGIWMDSTIYLDAFWNKEIYEHSFYSIKHGKSLYLSDGDWSTFFLACGKNNYLVNEIRKMFFNYWSNENYPIDYFIFDCIIKILRQNDPIVNEMINEIPINNLDVFYMNTRLNYDANKFVKKEGTYINKLSWKQKNVRQYGKNVSLYGKLLMDGKVE